MFSRLHERSAIVAIAIGCAALFASGCGGPKRLPVHGFVTLDGKPLPFGYITLAPKGNTSSPTAGAKIVDGKFSIASGVGLLAGEFRVEITASRPTNKTIRTPRGVFSNVDEQYLPARYNNRSELSAKIKPNGADPLSFNLTLE
jgi:hypothetical protein